MKRKNSYLSGLIDFIFPRNCEIQVSAFHILALCGVIVCVITAIYNLAIGIEPVTSLGNMLGIAFSVGLMAYTRRTGKYRQAMILTVLVVFIGLFSFLFLSSGGYHSGFPSFFIFGVVFTAFLLDGTIMPVLVVIEMMWYAGICLYAYYFPLPFDLTYSETKYMLDVVVCETIVSLSLAITMVLQIQLYRDKQEELNRAIFAAEDANRAKSDFLAKMSHDIRTPLNTMMAMNELIVANTSSERIREWVNDSNISGRILLSLIDDMLDLTKIEAGRLELLKQPWEPRLFFEETAKIWRMQAEKAGLTFEYEIDDEVPHRLIGDEDAVRKITNNLLSNAVKYTKKGKISLYVGWGEGDMVRLAVSDTGEGIAPDYLETIYRPFERGVQDIYRETSGSGLGLAIVKELVDAMEGKIECESVLNEGTTFTVIFHQKEYFGSEYLAENKEDALSEGAAAEQFVAPDARILVVDDNYYNRRVIEGFLEPTLIQLDDVESGFEALEMIDIREYDLILMDLRMPRMDGAETLKKIREEHPGFHTPVIALTADIMNGIEERLLKQGFSCFLAKPVSSTRLLQTIAGFLEGKLITIDNSGETKLTFAEAERYQEILMPYGVDIKEALENNAGDIDEFLMRMALFEEYADEGMERLKTLEPFENYYLQVHSIKSIARGVGAHMLAELSETVEFRKDDEFSRQTNPVLLSEYGRVRKGLNCLAEFMEAAG